MGGVVWCTRRNQPIVEKLARLQSAANGLYVLASAGTIVNLASLQVELKSSPAASIDDFLSELFRRFGLAAVERLAGTFSFVAWNKSRDELWAATDRAGHHPLYVLREEQESRLHLDFELESLLDKPGGRPALDSVAVAAHLNNVPVPLGKTFFSNIAAVPPASTLTVGSVGIRMQPYWAPEGSIDPRIEDGEWPTLVRERIVEVVREYLPQGLPAVSLSGGLDSTAVAAAARTVTPEDDILAVRGIAPDLPAADESRESAEVVERLRLLDVEVDVGRLWPLSGRPRIDVQRASPVCNIYDEFTRAVFLAAAERGAECVLTGFGGDRLFGGTVFSYSDLLLTGSWKRLAEDLKKHIPRSRFGSAGVVWRFVLRPLASPVAEATRPWRLHPVPWMAPRLLPFFRSAIAQQPRAPLLLLPGRRKRWHLLSSPLGATLCEWTSRQSRALGIEIRSPLTDHRLRELAFRLPSDQSMRGDVDKMVLRSAFERELPQSVLQKREKATSLPIALRGLREREREGVWELLTEMRAAEMGYVDERSVRDSYSTFLSGASDAIPFWNTLTLETWLRRYS